MAQPRVSVGLFVYKGDQFLREALDSLLGQTFGDFELIVSDNASTDLTPEICQTYAARDRRIRYLRNASNLGASRNANHTCALAQGEYFKWASHDDLCAPTMLERCVEVLDRHPATSLCYGRAVFIDETGRETERLEDDSLHLEAPRPSTRYRGYLERFLRRGNCNPIFGVMRRSVLMPTPLLYPYPSFDMILLGELALRGEVREVPEILYYRRDHAGRCVRANPGHAERLAWFDPTRVTAGDDEVTEPEVGVEAEDVPENRLSADGCESFRLGARLLSQAQPGPPAKIATLVSLIVRRGLPADAIERPAPSLPEVRSVSIGVPLASAEVHRPRALFRRVRCERGLIPKPSTNTACPTAATALDRASCTSNPFASASPIPS